MIENYFKTGKTAVIDDQYSEARPLLEALTKLHIPFIYSQGKPNSDYPLPSSSEYYNLIFLDLNLDFKFASGFDEQNEKNFKSTHSNILNNLLKNKNRSFILVIWSNEEEEYKEHFLKIFDEEEKYKTDKKFYKIISLKKTDFFNYNDQNASFEFKKNKTEELFDRIKRELKGIEAFKFFCEWDKIVSQSAGDTVDDIMGLINEFSENKREIELSKVLTAISIAYAGDDNYIKMTNDQQRTDSALLAITQLLVDDVDKNVIMERQEEFTSWQEIKKREDIKNLKNKVNAEYLNRKLLSHKPNRKDLTGSVYVLEKNNNSKKIFENYIQGKSNNNKASSKTKTGIRNFYKALHDTLDGHKDEDFEEFDNCKNYIYKNIIPVEVNITPLCDIAQGKAPVQRIGTGYLIPESFKNSFNCQGDNVYKSPVFNAVDEKPNVSYFLFLDFRYSITCPAEDIKNKKYLFTLRGNIMNDIQIKFSSHASRLGTLFF